MFDRLPKEMVDGVSQQLKETNLIKRPGEPSEVSNKLW